MLRFAGYRKPGAFKEMVKNNDKAFELDPDSAMGNAMKAATLHFSGEYEQAVSYIKQALFLNPNLAEVNFLAGALCRQIGLVPQAIRYFSKAVALDPYFGIYYGGVGQSYSNFGDHKKAAAFFERGYPMMPGGIFRPLTREYLILGNFDKAEKLIEEAENAGFNESWIQDARAWLYAFRGEKQKALEIKKEAEIYALLGKKNEALDIIEKAIDHPLAFNYLYLKNSSLFDSLRDQPRFHKILEVQKQKYEERLKWAEGL
jgi:tetratricopeptide (TPR) repeat protein